MIREKTIHGLAIIDAPNATIWLWAKQKGVTINTTTTKQTIAHDAERWAESMATGQPYHAYVNGEEWVTTPRGSVIIAQNRDTTITVRADITPKIAQQIKNKLEAS